MLMRESPVDEPAQVPSPLNPTDLDWWWGDGVVGGVIGGLVTGLAVWLTLRHERKLRTDERGHQAKESLRTEIAEVQATALRYLLTTASNSFEELAALSRQTVLLTATSQRVDGDLGEDLSNFLTLLSESSQITKHAEQQRRIRDLVLKLKAFLEDWLVTDGAGRPVGHVADWETGEWSEQGALGDRGTD